MQKAALCTSGVFFAVGAIAHLVRLGYVSLADKSGRKPAKYRIKGV